MYIPDHFAQNDPAALTRLMRENSFALLVTVREGRQSVSHLPLLFEPQEEAGHSAGTSKGADADVSTDGSQPAGPAMGTLLGHMARANPHWRDAAGEALAVFSGPHAYVSPTWYEAERVVPTWNYAAVHAWGKLSLVDDLDESMALLKKMVRFYEQGQPSEWDFSSDDEWFRRLAGGIVAFRIDVTRIEGKWKLSQNQPPERREKVMNALAQSNDAQSQSVAALMRSYASRMAD